MKASEYLRQLKIANEKLDMIQREIDTLYAVQLQAIKTDTVHGSGDNDKTLHVVEKILALKEKFQLQLSDVMETREKIVKTICELKDANELKIVYLKTCQYMTFYEISKEMDYSERHVKRMYYEALVKLEKILNDDTICHDIMCNNDSVKKPTKLDS